MTKDELLELLLVERHTPLPGQPETPHPEPESVVVDDSEVTVKRRRRELYEEVSGFEVDDMTGAWGVKG